MIGWLLDLFGRRRYGWRPDPDAVAEFVASLPQPFFSTAAPWLAETGKGKVVLLHKLLEKAAGTYPVTNQGSVGSCVGFGTAKAAMTTYAADIHLKNEPEEWRAPFAEEAIYGLSRVEIGGGRLRGDGSIGAWAAKAIVDYGLLLRKKYDSVDLTRYSESLCREWGRRGLPADLERLAKENPAGGIAQVRSYEEVRDAIANGYGVIVCSMRGFSMRRDSEGFCRPSGRWPHCMAFVSVDDQHGRPGLLCDNSWGPYMRGQPARHGQPDSAFWVDADVADAMLRQNDSWAVPGVKGWARQVDRLDYSQW